MGRRSQLMRAFEGFIYTTLSPLLLCDNNSNTERKSTNRVDTFSMTDKEIDKAATSSPKIDAGSFFLYEMDTESTEDNAVIKTPFVGSAARITPNAVTKYCSSTGQLQLLAANLVLKIHLSLFRNMIGLPPVSLFTTLFKNTYLDGLSWWRRFRIAPTLRYYIYQLHCMSVPDRTTIFPGPPAVYGKPLLCEGRLFTSDGSGPFHTDRNVLSVHL